MPSEDFIRLNFFEMPMSPGTMAFYPARTAIFREVREAAEGFDGCVVDLGCGLQPYRTIVLSNPGVTEYIGVDIESSPLYSEVTPDLFWDGMVIPLPDGKANCVMATELLEHVAEPVAVLREINRVLASGGTFFATVPFVWNLHEIPHDEYRYTPYSLHRMMTESGFSNIRIRALGGFNLALAQMLALWIQFSKMRSIWRRLFAWLFFPFYALLIKTDRIPDSFDGTANSMFTGLSVTCTK